MADKVNETPEDTEALVSLQKFLQTVILLFNVWFGFRCVKLSAFCRIMHNYSLSAFSWNRCHVVPNLSIVIRSVLN